MNNTESSVKGYALIKLLDCFRGFLGFFASTSLFFSLISVAGCIPSMGPAYIPSAESNAPRVTFISRSGGINIATLALSGPMQGCLCSSEQPEIIGIFFNVARLVKNSSSYADQGKKSDRFSVSVPPGQEFRFMLPIAQYHTDMSGDLWESTTRYCQAHESFVPKASGVYEVLYDLNVNQCGVSVYEFVEGKSLPVETRKYPLCLQAQNASASDWLSTEIRDHCRKRTE